MSLTSEMESQGNWLFRWRSFLPLLGLPALIAVLSQMTWPFNSYWFHEVWEIFCLAVSLAGLAVRVVTAGYVPDGTSGRNTKTQVAASLNTTGIYSVVRHPLYLGNFLIGLGAFLVPFEWWLPLLYAAVYYLYYERIMIAEEGFLFEQFGEQFVQWAERTPAFVPRFSTWARPARAFSLCTVFRREYTALIMVVLLHFGIEIVEHWFIEHRIHLELSWGILLAASALIYLVVRTLKKHTQVLVIPEG